MKYIILLFGTFLNFSLAQEQTISCEQILTKEVDDSSWNVSDVLACSNFALNATSINNIKKDHDLFFGFHDILFQFKNNKFQALVGGNPQIKEIHTFAYSKNQALLALLDSEKSSIKIFTSLVLGDISPLKTLENSTIKGTLDLAFYDENKELLLLNKDLKSVLFFNQVNGKLERSLDSLPVTMTSILVNQKLKKLYLFDTYKKQILQYSLEFKTKIYFDNYEKIYSLPPDFDLEDWHYWFVNEDQFMEFVFRSKDDSFILK